MADNTTIGGNGKDGELHIRSGANEPLFDVAVGTSNPRRVDAEVTVGGSGRNGVLRIRRAKDARQTTISDSGMSLYGHLSINSNDKNPLNINPFGDEMRVLLGDTEVAAYLQLTSGSNGPGPIIEVSGKDNAIRMGGPGVDTSTIEIIGTKGQVAAGGEGVNGGVVVNGTDGKPRVTMSGATATVRAGGSGSDGTVTVVNGNRQARVSMTAADATLRVGGHGADGTVSVVGADGQPLLELLGRANEAVLGLGQKNRPARISLYNAQQAEAIKLDAAAGDIMLANADAAELFDVSGPAEPGSVMVIGDEGLLEATTTAYDTRVAGIVSGAGTFKPGLLLDQRETAYERAPIALMGKVFCRVDATSAPIRVGDLLTTSTTEGHAMRLVDSARGLGAVVGKALAPLTEGTGLIPVLVTLQ